MFLKPFSFQGRINRFEYGITVILCSLLFYVTYLISESNILKINVIVYYLPTFLLLFAQGAKREHDLGYSAWLQFMPFRIIWLILSEGEKINNKYGDSLYNQGE